MSKNRMNEDNKKNENARKSGGSRPIKRRTDEKAANQKTNKNRSRTSSGKGRRDESEKAENKRKSKPLIEQEESAKKKNGKNPGKAVDKKKRKSFEKTKNSGKKAREAELADKRNYDDEFFTDELELKRKRAKQRIDDKLIDDIDFEKKPLSHRGRKIKNVGVAISIVSGVLIIGIVLSLTVFFRSEEFKVEGTEYYSAQDIIDASGLSLGENLFLSDKRAGEQSIESGLPYVEQAKISIKIPNTMLISVTESTPAFLFKNGNEYIVVSTKGKVLEKITGSTDKFNVPLVLGGTIAEAKPGQEIKFKESGILTILKDISEAIAENEFSGIKEIDVTNTANISLNYSNRIKIIVGLPEDISYKIKTAKIIISEKLSEADRGRLDVSNCKSSSKASYFKSISDQYLDKIEATEAPTEETKATEAETQYQAETTAEEHPNSVPQYEYPTDSNEDYGDYTSFAGGDDGSYNNGYDYGDNDYSYDYSGGNDDGNDTYGYDYEPDDNIY